MGTMSESSEIFPMVSEYDELIEEILELERKVGTYEKILMRMIPGLRFTMMSTW